MAKNMLPVDFRDDILSENMNNRRRYQMINNSDGTVSLVDVTEYEQVGSVFGQAQINAICAAVNGLTDSVSDAFSEEKTYAVGDYAIYENTLYRFIAAKTAGAWNPAAAEAVTVAGEICKLNGNLMSGMVISRTLTTKYSAAANNGTFAEAEVPDIAGYKPVAVIAAYSESWKTIVSGVSISGSGKTAMATLFNTSTSPVNNISFSWNVLYVRNAS